MDRRDFLAAMAAMPALTAQELKGPRPTPTYRVVTRYGAAPNPGMPGPFPGRVITVHSPNSIDVATEKADAPTVKQANPNVNRFIREPGHIDYASTLGLGVYDTDKIRHTEITV